MSDNVSLRVDGNIATPIQLIAPKAAHSHNDVAKVIHLFGIALGALLDMGGD
jgi:hypothetical protein